MTFVYPQSVQIIEVGPRDGLQNEKIKLPTSDKVKFINDLSACGHSSIEVTSFVNLEKIPHLADSEKVFNLITQSTSCAYSALVANQKGYERAMRSGVKHLALVTSASETFCKKNINCSIEESLSRIQSIIHKVKQLDIRIRVYISCAFDCVFEGSVDPGHVSKLVEKIMKMNCDEISLADTTGRATPAHIEQVIKKCLPYLPFNKMAMHFHDTYGQALANVLASLQMGVHRFDTSAAGIGGCNFSPGASGNLATEDLVFMLHGMGIQTGIDFDQMVAVGNKVSAMLGHVNVSRVSNQLTKLKGAR
ncbi:hydroxymethylglutaryl-CoA lyase [Beggiatoa alba]|nr:hydroxymethylglutaryl-CoA lyase [Beggiatoa alba]